MAKKLMIIGHVWPEPNSSAAGQRMLQLMEVFLSANWNITFASAAVMSEHTIDLGRLDVTIEHIAMNDPAFDTLITETQPEVVLFDRFMTEEQFGWRVTKHAPGTLKILNTEDLHFLRKVRQEAYMAGIDFKNSQLLTSNHTKREIASIYRCDLTLLISDFEKDLLQKVFGIKSGLLAFVPFLLDPITSEIKKLWPTFEKRKHFISIGNFRHEPNWNSILFLKETIWPLIKKDIPDAELHIYGAYPPPKATQLHHAEEGFFIKGWTKNANVVMSNAKVCLAPLRFGAGIKGKLARAMLCGTPSVTTSIGSEGMHDEDDDWNGFITDDPKKFARAAVKLYTNEQPWKQSQQNGIQIINTRFAKKKYVDDLLQNINHLKANLVEHRTNNFIGNMLQYHSLRSTEFMSRWIEEKNKNKT